MNSYPLKIALALTVVTSLPALAKHQIEEEVIVTASLVPIGTHQTANAVTIIDADELKHKAPLVVSDILRDVPGLAVSRSGVLGSTTQIRVRGAEGNHLLVLVDGVEINDPSQGDELNWGTLTAAGIERIEVIRGPMSALYGSDAVAGVVNMITREAEAPLEAMVYAEAGSFATRHHGLSLGHGSERFNIRFGVSDLDAEGDNISRTGGEDDGYRNRSYNLKGGWEASKQLSLSFAARQNDGRNEFDAVDFYTTGLPTDANLYSEFRNESGRLQGDYAALDGHWWHRLSYARSNNANENFNTGMVTGSTSSQKDQYQYLNSLFWAEDAQRLSLLLEREEEDFKQRGPISAYGDDPNQDLSRQTDSIAVEYRGTFDALTLGASARHDDNSKFDSAETYRLEASYQHDDLTHLRAAWGVAVKNPTFTELFGFYASSPFFPFVGNPDLEPEESKSWELGIDQALLDGRLELSLTWFQAKLEKEIYGFAFDPVRLATTAVNLDGESRRQGVELGVVAQLSDAFSLEASYTYTDSTQEDGATGGDIDELRRARHIASATLAWQAQDNLQINLNTQYNGRQNDQFYPPWPQPSQIVALDDYTLVNLNATWGATPDLEFYLRLDNLFDEDYEEVFGFQTPGLGGYLGVRYLWARQ